MKKNVHVSKRYFNLPVKSDLPLTHVIITDPETDKIIRYFDVAIGKDSHDFMAFFDMSPYIGKNIVIDMDEDAEFIQSDEPMALEGVYGEPHRPQYHFSSKRGWLNDPNGLFFYGGKYHMFYQHNPFGTRWGNMHWGHATSSDLLHWQEDGDVLCPDELGFMFSGSAVVDWNNNSGLQAGTNPPILLFYTAAGAHAPQPRESTQCMAYSTDDGNSFRKYEKNPVLDFIAKDARDPKIVRDKQNSRWIMSLYPGNGNSFRLFQSSDLLAWEAIGETVSIPGGAECPDLFPLPLDGNSENVKWIFLEASGKYLIGSVDKNGFIPESGPFPLFTRLGTGCCYAGQTWSDAPGNRRIFIGWQQGSCEESVFDESMTVPMELSLKRFQDGIRLCSEPVRELETIRGRSWSFENLCFEDRTPESLLKIPVGNLWDIELTPKPEAELCLSICGTNIAISTKEREIRMDAAKLSFPHGMEEPELRILVDKASIEIFGAGGRICFPKRAITAHSYPLILANGRGSLKKLKIYGMRSVWH